MELIKSNLPKSGIKYVVHANNTIIVFSSTKTLRYSNNNLNISE